MELENIMVTIAAIFIAFAKEIGSFIWAFRGVGAIEELLEDIGRIADTKIVGRKEKFLNKTEDELTPKERDLYKWVTYHVNLASEAKAIRLYKCCMFWKIALVFLVISCAIPLAIEAVHWLSGNNYYWPWSAFCYIFLAAASIGAWGRCTQCSLRVSDAARRLEVLSNEVRRALEIHGTIEGIDPDKEPPEIYVKGDEAAVKTIWQVRKMVIDKEVRYILHGNG